MNNNIDVNMLEYADENEYERLHGNYNTVNSNQMIDYSHIINKPIRIIWLLLCIASLILFFLSVSLHHGKWISANNLSYENTITSSPFEFCNANTCSNIFEACHYNGFHFSNCSLLYTTQYLLIFYSVMIGIMMLVNIGELLTNGRFEKAARYISVLSWFGVIAGILIYVLYAIWIGSNAPLLSFTPQWDEGLGYFATSLGLYTILVIWSSTEYLIASLKPFQSFQYVLYTYIFVLCTSLIIFSVLNLYTTTFSTNLYVLPLLVTFMLLGQLKSGELDEQSLALSISSCVSGYIFVCLISGIITVQDIMTIDNILDGYVSGKLINSDISYVTVDLFGWICFLWVLFMSVRILYVMTKMQREQMVTSDNLFIDLLLGLMIISALIIGVCYVIYSYNFATILGSEYFYNQSVIISISCGISAAVLLTGFCRKYFIVSAFVLCGCIVAILLNIVVYRYLKCQHQYEHESKAPWCGDLSNSFPILKRSFTGSVAGFTTLSISLIISEFLLFMGFLRRDYD